MPGPSRGNSRPVPATETDEPTAELDYTALLQFRTALRRFNQWSQTQAEAVGLTHIQHQLLLAIKGHPDPRGPRITDVADHLLIRHHSAVELITRVQNLGFLDRHPDPNDRRTIRLHLTSSGEQRIRALTAVHVRELATLAPLLQIVTDHTTGLSD